MLKIDKVCPVCHMCIPIFKGRTTILIQDGIKRVKEVYECTTTNELFTIFRFKTERIIWIRKSN
jgi:hypothetical protein